MQMVIDLIQSGAIIYLISKVAKGGKRYDNRTDD